MLTLLAGRLAPEILRENLDFAKFPPAESSGELESEMASTTVVNLDALIPRANFADGETSDNINGLTLNGLERGALVYKYLRKPDFQRETANWKPEQVAQLIITFLTKDLVPALVLWEAGQKVFVIDGAHRLSALIGWVHDDYGDGDVSRGYFRGNIPKAQKEAADRVREIVHPVVGKYSEHKADNPASAEIAERAKMIGFHEIPVQWIRKANAVSAENSFFRINQGGTPIDPTESRIIHARDTATAMSARAIIRGGTGNEYWGKFEASNKEKVEALGSEIHKLLFEPIYEFPVKTLDLPPGGFGYGPSVLPFAFDLVNLSNEVPVGDSSRKKADKAEVGFVVDVKGDKTVDYLTRVRELIWRVCSNHPSSLGLHPALYFYNASGIFQPNSLLAILEMISKWGTADFRKFTEARKGVEGFLLSNRGTTEAVRNLGSGSRSRPRLRALYKRLMELSLAGKTADEMFTTLIGEPDFKFLDVAPPKVGQSGRPFARAVKSTSFINTSLPTTAQCPTCSGMLYARAMQIGHKVAKRVGGSGGIENSAMQHPFCNSTYDN